MLSVEEKPCLDPIWAWPAFRCRPLRQWVRSLRRPLPSTVFRSNLIPLFAPSGAVREETRLNVDQLPVGRFLTETSSAMLAATMGH